MIVSGSGNDIGFANIVATCVANDNCWDTKVNGQLIKDDRFPNTLAEVVNNRLAGLSGEDTPFSRLADAIHDPASPWHLNVANVLLTEYFNPTKNDEGNTCGVILQDIAGWPFDIKAEESNWAVNNVITPLNLAIKAAANQQVANGRPWHYVSDIASAFAGPSGGPGHGYCARNNWVRTATEAMYLQGPFPETLGGSSEREAKIQGKGTLHPNIDGHRVIKDRIMRTLRDVLQRPGSLPASPSVPTFDISNSIADSSGSSTSLAGPQGWLIGSCVGSACTSESVVLTVSAQDGVAIRGASLSVNDSPIGHVDGALQCPTGLTCNSGLAADGKSYTWSFRITQEGAYRFRVAAKGDDDQVATLTHEVRVDLTDPTAFSILSRQPDQAGGYIGPFDITLGGLDTSTGAGIDRIEYWIDQTDGPPSYVASGNKITIPTDGVHTVRYQAIDLAGRRSALATLEVNVDATAPILNCGTADGLWHASNLFIPCTASDMASGLVDAANDSSFSLVTNVAEDIESANASTSDRQACDKVGNCATAGPISGNQIDRKAPVVTINSPVATSYVLGEVVDAVYACDDGGSGVATCDGTVTEQSQIDTSSVGTKTFTVSAVDRTGNAVSQSVAYTVTHNISKLYDPTRAYKGGSVAPIKLQLHDATHANVSSPAVTITASGVRQTSSDAAVEVQDAGNANPDSNFRYDETLGGYIFNLSTSGLATGSYELGFTVAGDPEPHTVPFSLR